MKFEIETPTYTYKKPILFLQKEYSNSMEMAEIFLDKWEFAVAAFRGGVFLDFWKVYVDAGNEVVEKNDLLFREIYDRMWSQDETINLDVLFTKVFHVVEPAIKKVPIWEFESEQLCLYDFQKIRKKYEEPCQLDNCYFSPKYDKEYSTGYQESLYLSHMLRERVFSLWGCQAVEDPFLEILEKRDVNIEEYKEAFHKAGRRIYDQETYIWQGTACRTLEEFASLWKDDCDEWNVEEWDDFLSELCQEREYVLGFYQWINNLGKQADDLDVLQFESEWEQKNQLLKKNFEKILFKGCFAWGKKIDHMKEWDRISTKVDEMAAFKEKYSQLTWIKSVMSTYEDIYNKMHKLCGITETNWQNTKLKQMIDDCYQNWENWEKDLDKIYESYKKMLEAIYSQDVLSNWEYPFEKFNGVDAKEVMILLSCAPIEETYQKNSMNCLEFLRNANVSAKEIKKYIEDIYVTYVVDFLDGQAPDDVIAFYLRLMYKLAELKPDINDMHYYDEDVVNKVVKKSDFTSLPQMTSDDSMNKLYLVDSDNIKGLKNRELKVFSRNINSLIDYKSFYATSVYQSMEQERELLDNIGKKWIDLSEKIADKQNRFLVNVQCKWNDRHFIELKCYVDQLVHEHEILKSDLKTIRDEWINQCQRVNKAISKAVDARKAYEAEWEKKQKLKKEAERKRKIRISKFKETLRIIRNFIVIAAVVLGIVVLIIKLVVYISGIIDSRTGVWEEKNGILVSELKDPVFSFKSFEEYFADNVEKAIDENGTLEIPKKANKIGDLSFVFLQSVDYKTSKKIRKVVFPEGVTDILASFDISDYEELHEVEFPSTLVSIDGNWTNTGIYSLYAENVTTILGTESYGSVFSGTDVTGGAFSQNDWLKDIHFPKLQNVGAYAFYDCERLQKVTLESACLIGERAFAECEDLTNVNLSSAEEFDYYVFEGCKKLGNVYLPEAKKMCLSSFYRCENLRNVYLPKVEKVYFNKSLTSGRIYIGSSVQLVDFQLVPTVNEAGETENIYEKHNIEIVLDTNGQYLPEVMEVFNKVSSDPNTYGNVKIVYEDFSALDVIQ